MNAFWASENFDAFMFPLLFPAGKLSRKTPVMNGPVFEDQSKVNRTGAPEGQRRKKPLDGA
jgi:hypothetical protein